MKQDNTNIKLQQKKETIKTEQFNKQSTTIHCM